MWHAKASNKEEATDEARIQMECSRELDQQAELESLIVELRDSRVRVYYFDCIIEGGLLTHAMEAHYCDCIIEGGLLTRVMEAHYCDCLILVQT